MHTSNSGPLKSTETTLEIIEAIRERGSLGVTETATILDIPKSTASDHLRTLRQNGYLIADNGTYRLGLRFLELGDRARNDHGFFRTAKPQIDQLARNTGELVHLSVEENGSGVIIYEAEGERAVSLDTFVGRRVPMHCTALGQVMLAEMPRERVEETIAEKGLPAVTEETITDEAQFFRHLEAVREEGYATIRGERVPELGSVAVPVEENGTVYGAVSVCCPMSRASDERFEEELPKRVLEAANRITLDLKYS